MRPLVAHIYLNHLRHNYQLAKAAHGNKVLAVLKANAYGHGSARCAAALVDLVDGFAVACLEEALQLRHAGVKQPIVLLEGVFAADEYDLVDKYGLWPVIQTQIQLDTFLVHNWQRATTVWLKMDSGMHRAGFSPQDYSAAYHALTGCLKVENIVKMTHFACADELEKDTTITQIQTFDAVCQQLPGEESLANSAAIFAHPAARRDWGRVGIALYGASPISKQSYGLKAVMHLKTRVFGIRDVAAGEAVGYGAIFVTPKPMKIGLIACGYADGYPRLASTDSPVMVDQQISRVIARVSMDMMMVDLTHLPDARIGSEVELWGETVAINEVAAHAKTISYEPLCNVKRAYFKYLD